MSDHSDKDIKNKNDSMVLPSLTNNERELQNLSAEELDVINNVLQGIENVNDPETTVQVVVLPYDGGLTAMANRCEEQRDNLIRELHNLIERNCTTTLLPLPGPSGGGVEKINDKERIEPTRNTTDPLEKSRRMIRRGKKLQQGTTIGKERKLNKGTKRSLKSFKSNYVNKEKIGHTPTSICDKTLRKKAKHCPKCKTAAKDDDHQITKLNFTFSKEDTSNSELLTRRRRIMFAKRQEDREEREKNTNKRKQKSLKNKTNVKKGKAKKVIRKQKKTFRKDNTK